MANDDVTLTLDGAPERRGHVLARALVDKVDRFLKTFGAFERAYLDKRVRQTDFEVTGLSHNSPAAVELHPVPRVAHHIPSPVVDWTLAQWEKISKGERPDSVVTDDMVNDVVDLGRPPENSEFSVFTVSYRARRINFDEKAEANALAIHADLAAKRGALPWMKGLSLGSLTGELRSVLDASHERQIVICPPLGRVQIPCVFDEQHREMIKEYLFRFVRVTGTLHYGDKSPLPYLIEIRKIEPIIEADDRPHLQDGYGLFKDSYYARTESTID